MSARARKYLHTNTFAHMHGKREKEYDQLHQQKTSFAFFLYTFFPIFLAFSLIFFLVHRIIVSAFQSFIFLTLLADTVIFCVFLFLLNLLLLLLLSLVQLPIEIAPHSGINADYIDRAKKKPTREREREREDRREETTVKIKINLQKAESFDVHFHFLFLFGRFIRQIFYMIFHRFVFVQCAFFVSPLAETSF